MRDKTLVAWVSPANLTQRGGSVLTIEKPGGVFDAIVLGELAPANWMPGSDCSGEPSRSRRISRRRRPATKPLVQVAIVYQDRQITLYRNGTQSATYTADGAERFGTTAWS